MSIVDIIGEMLPSASKFRGSDFEKILNETFSPLYDKLEAEVDEVYNSYFINLANGKDLDRLGKLYNVVRGDGESDDDYRDRISFQADQFCNRENLEELGCEIVEQPTEEYSLDTTLLSRNIVEDKAVIIICPTEDVKETVSRNYLLDNVSIIVG